MDIGFSRCRFDVSLRDLSGVVAVGDVVANGHVEENRLLLDKAEQRAEPLNVQCFHIMSVEQHGAAKWVVEPQD